MKIDRFQLIEADQQDGKLDGSLTKQQLQELDPSLANQAEERGLLDSNEALPYAQYIDRFAEGVLVWEGMGATLDSVPLLDALLMGKKTEELRKKVVVRVESDRPVKSASELLKEINQILGPTVTNDINSLILFDKIIHPPVDSMILIPGSIFRQAAEAYLNDLQGRLKNKISQDKIKSVMAINVFEDPSPQEKQVAINTVYAALVYRAHYFFPKLEDQLWGGIVQLVNLSFEKGHLQTFNPFDQAMQPPGEAAHFEEETKTILFYLPLVLPNLIDSAAEKNHDEVLHEMGHAVSRIDSRAKGIATFFSNLPAASYKNIFGWDYGNKEAFKKRNRKLDPVEETHSVLIEATKIGSCFSEISVEAGKIKLKLQEFRDLIQNNWGYQGPPEWAVSMWKYCQSSVKK